MGCGSSAVHRPELAALSPQRISARPESVDDIVRYQQGILADLRLHMLDSTALNVLDQLHQLLDRHTSITRTAISDGEDAKQQLDVVTGRLREAEKQLSDSLDPLSTEKHLSDSLDPLSARKVFVRSPQQQSDFTECTEPEIIMSDVKLGSKLDQSKSSKEPLQQLNPNNGSSLLFMDPSHGSGWRREETLNLEKAVSEPSVMPSQDRLTQERQSGIASTVNQSNLSVALTVLLQVNLQLKSRPLGRQSMPIAEPESPKASSAVGSAERSRTDSVHLGRVVSEVRETEAYSRTIKFEGSPAVR